MPSTEELAITPKSGAIPRKLESDILLKSLNPSSTGYQIYHKEVLTLVIETLVKHKGEHMTDELILMKVSLCYVEDDETKVSLGHMVKMCLKRYSTIGSKEQIIIKSAVLNPSGNEVCYYTLDERRMNSHCLAYALFQLDLTFFEAYKEEKVEGLFCRATMALVLCHYEITSVYLDKLHHLCKKLYSGDGIFLSLTHYVLLKGRENPRERHRCLEFLKRLSESDDKFLKCFQKLILECILQSKEATDATFESDFLHF